MRIDLNGEAASYVNAVDAKRADDELMRRRVKTEARREATVGPVHSSPAPMSERPKRLSLGDLKRSASRAKEQ